MQVEGSNPMPPLCTLYLHNRKTREVMTIKYGNSCPLNYELLLYLNNIFI